MLFPTVGWPTTSALAANFAYLYTLPLCTFFSSLYHNVVIQSTLLQHCNNVSSSLDMKKRNRISNRGNPYRIPIGVNISLLLYPLIIIFVEYSVRKV